MGCNSFLHNLATPQTQMWLGEIQRKNLSQVNPRQLIGRV